MGVARSDETSADSPKIETMEELFRALESPLLSYAFRLVGQRALAEDLVQETFMKLHAQFEQVREPRRWVYRTVHNLALNHQRQAGKVVSLELPSEDELQIPDPQPLPDEQIARWEGIGLVRLTLKSLDSRRQELIRLKFSEGLSYQEISTRTGLSVSNIGYMLHQAIKEIAAELSKNGGLR